MIYSTALIMYVHWLLIICKNRLIEAFTCTRGSIACESSVTRTCETSFSVVTSCPRMALRRAFDTLIYICSQTS